MLLTAYVRREKRLNLAEDETNASLKQRLKAKRSLIPAVTHVDFSARLQTVNAKTNPLFYGLLKAFEKKTGCPVLVNTSFNVRGEPIVNTPQEAHACFLRTYMDALVLGSFLLLKEDQPEGHLKRYPKEAIALD
jgi:carbamoyltransferase